MKANLSQKEVTILKKWQRQGLYRKLREARAKRPKFILHDGPPYANGNLHLGHAVNKILKDIIIKSRSLEGMDAPYIPGWDCHGLPIEYEVEKKIGKAGTKVDFGTFRQKCRDYALRQIDNQRKEFIRMGVFGDWDAPYLTLSKKNEADIIRALGCIAIKGHLVRGYKPVYWSVVGRSALAEAEVEYRQKQSFSIDVAYSIKAESRQRLASMLGVALEPTASIQIWTTTPWTLPSSLAISVNPKLTYLLVRIGEEQVILAKELLELTLTRMELDEYQILATFPGSDLEGIIAGHPFYRRDIPVLLGTHVTTEAGTGCVHSAPDHGIDDYYICQAKGINTLNYVDEGGLFKEQVDLFAGQHVYKVDEAVIECLRQQKRLRSCHSLQHSYPHCWRTKTPLIYRATPQWFISMKAQGLDKQLTSEIKSVRWTPSWGEGRIASMLDSSPDWCVSRQRSWGVPITLLVHRETGELHPDMEALIAEIAQSVENEGMEAWFESSAERWVGAEATDYKKTSDTLDVWFDSGVTHYTVLQRHPDLHFPADLYLEGSDQHRGWFQSSLKTSVAINGCAPYKSVLTHGFVVDSKGRKMSKSLGNITSPDHLIKQHGADILRLWVAATDYSAEIVFSNEAVERLVESYRRIRNTLRYCLANLNHFEVANDQVPPEQLLALDAWAIDMTAQLQQQVRQHYQHYQFHLVYQLIHRFCIVEMGAVYLDIIKDRIYTCPPKSRARLSAQTAIYYIAQSLSRCISPILSFTADEIWDYLDTDQESIFLTEHIELPKITNSLIQPEEWQQLMAIKNQFNQALELLRQQQVVGSSLAIDLVLGCSDELLKLLGKVGDELHYILITSSARVVGMKQFREGTDDRFLFETNIEGLWLQLSLSTAPSCARCWHHCPSVDSDASRPKLCIRCIENIDGAGELRRYA